MKSIEKISEVYAKGENYELESYFYSIIKDAFYDGVQEAQKFFSIERDCNGEITNKCKNEISNYMPFLAQRKNGEYVVCDSVLCVKSRTDFIKWRPINRG